MNKSVKRINPLFEAAATKTLEKANNNSLDTVNKCPVCQDQMQILSCNGIDAFVCKKHRVVLPTQDA